jgi:hypothetical protein
MGVEGWGMCHLARVYLLFDENIETTSLYFLETAQLMPKAAVARAVMRNFTHMQHANKM